MIVRRVLLFVLFGTLACSAGDFGGGGGKKNPSSGKQHPADGADDEDEDSDEVDSKPAADDKRPIDEGEGVPGYELADPALVSLGWESEQPVARGKEGAIAAKAANDALPICVAYLQPADKKVVDTAAKTVAVAKNGAFTLKLAKAFDPDLIVTLAISEKCEGKGTIAARYAPRQIFTKADDDALFKLKDGPVLAIMEPKVDELPSDTQVTVTYRNAPTSGKPWLAFAEQATDESLFVPATDAQIGSAAEPLKPEGTVSIKTPVTSETRAFLLRLFGADDLPYGKTGESPVAIAAIPAADLGNHVFQITNATTGLVYNLSGKFSPAITNVSVVIAEPGSEVKTDDASIADKLPVPSAGATMGLVYNLPTTVALPHVWEARLMAKVGDTWQLAYRRYFKQQ